MIDAVKQLRAVVQELADSEGKEGVCYFCGLPYWNLPRPPPHARDCLIVQARAALTASARLEARLVALEAVITAARREQEAQAALDALPPGTIFGGEGGEIDQADNWFSAHEMLHDALAELDGEASQ